MRLATASAQGRSRFGQSHYLGEPRQCPYSPTPTSIGLLTTLGGILARRLRFPLEIFGTTLYEFTATPPWFIYKKGGVWPQRQKPSSRLGFAHFLGSISAGHHTLSPNVRG